MPMPKHCQSSRFVEMFRKPGDVRSEAMTRSIGSQDVGFVGAGEYEGLPRERRRVVEVLP